MDAHVLTAIRGLLRQRGVEFQELHHRPTYTSAESAHARGGDLRVGGKALLLKTDERFSLFVLSGAAKVDSAAIRRHLAVKKVRFATADELLSLIGLVPGCVPPFGRPILEVDLFLDSAMLKNHTIAFNAGSLTTSIVMSIDDYVKVAEPKIFQFSLSG